MAKSGINAKDIKYSNRGLLLKYLITADRPLSRGELTERSGLSRMTVYNIIAEFVQSGLITESAEAGIPVSKSNPTLLKLSPTAPRLIGLRIRRHSCMATLCDLQLRPLENVRISTENCNPQELLEIVVKLIAPWIAEHTIMGIGIGTLGPVVDSKNGIILAQFDYRNLESLPIKEYLESRFHIPVFIEHTYGWAALAERYFGAAKGYTDYLFVGMAGGFSLGVVNSGYLQSTRSGLTGEIGHISINFDGPLCRCGNKGCLETYTGIKKLEEAVANSPLIGQSMTFPEICANCDQPAVHQIIMQELVYYLLPALVNTVHLLNPEMIFLGDRLALLPDRYFNYIEQELNNRYLSRNFRYIHVRRPHLPIDDSVAFCAIGPLSDIFEHGFCPPDNH